MARTKGALNKRTRSALSQAAEGEFAKGAESTIRYLLKVTTDSKRDDSLRMQAANVVLPYLRPKLSAIEQTNLNPEDQVSREALETRMAELAHDCPELKPIITAILAKQKAELLGTKDAE
jgi:hypothetical protein